MQKSKIPLFFSQGRAEDLLAQSLGIAQRDRPALAGSIKYLRRQGFPKISGRGKRASFTSQNVFELRVALQLTELDLPPRVVIEAAGIAARAATKVTSGSDYALLLAFRARPRVVLLDEAVDHIRSGKSATVVPLFEIVRSFADAIEGSALTDDFLEDLLHAADPLEERILRERER